MQNLATTVRIAAYTSSTECIQWKSKPFGIDFTVRYLLRRTVTYKLHCLTHKRTASFYLTASYPEREERVFLIFILLFFF